MSDRIRMKLWPCGLTLLLLLASMTAAQAGGFFIVVEQPGARSDPKLNQAVMIVRPGGCIDPALATLSPGVYAVKRQWPKEGVWVLAFTSTVDRLTCSRLVPLGPNGEAQTERRPGSDPSQEAIAKSVYRKATAGEIDAALQTLARKGGRNTPISRAAP
jgi:hypothetical protein